MTSVIHVLRHIFHRPYKFIIQNWICVTTPDVSSSSLPLKYCGRNRDNKKFASYNCQTIYYRIY